MSKKYNSSLSHFADDFIYFFFQIQITIWSTLHGSKAKKDKIETSNFSLKFFVKMSPWRKKILRMTREIKTQTCSSSVYLKNVSSPSHDDFDYENSSTEISGTE